MMIPRFLVAALCVLGPLTCVAHGGDINGEATYVSFSVPGALGTYPMSINASMTVNAGGTIAGWYTNCNPVNNLGGFVMSPDGDLTLFKPAGTILTSALPQTTPYYQPQDPPYLESLTAPRVLSIDQAGDITGSYTDAAGVQHGFVRNPYGTITSFDPPEGNQTTATSINDGGAIAGFYHYHAGGGPRVGFIRVPQ
jgi:hypothetical protein